MEPDPLYLEFGKLVRQHRRRLGLTQDRLGERVALSRTSITNIEQGRQKVLLHQLFSLAQSLSVSPEALLPSAQVSPPNPEIEPKLPRDLTGPQKAWVRRVVGSSSAEGGPVDAQAKD